MKAPVDKDPRGPRASNPTIRIRAKSNRVINTIAGGFSGGGEFNSA
ncbi:hypothetical protein A2U01_0079073, partial [Trifolium medium]|nr:hypothetical protein [Trifolium medium]